MRKLFKSLVVLVTLATLSFASGKHTIIEYKKAKGMQGAGSALFIDARGAKLYKKGTIPTAINIPTKKYKKMKKYLPAKNTKIVAFCNGFKCEKAEELADMLQKDGFTRVLVYKGGFPEWKEKKQPYMALAKPCKGKKKAYKPNPKTKITINGAKVYWGGEERGDGMIDQFWFASKVNKGKIPANVQLVDIRKASQYKEGHIKGAINIPWDSANEKVDHTKFPKGKLVVFYCNTGMQSTDARGSLSDDVAKGVLYFDANVDCKGTKCKVTPNENL